MPDCTNCNCKYEQVIKELVEDKERNRKRHERFYSYITESEKQKGSLEEWQKRILDELKQIKADVTELKNRPVKRYESILGSVAQWATLLLLGLLAAKWGIM